MAQLSLYTTWPIPINRMNYTISPVICAPLCSTEEETFLHVLICRTQSATTTQEAQLQHLRDTLTTIHTPDIVTQTILQGFTHWLTPPSQYSRAPTTGSLCSPDVILTVAYHEQYHTLGWFQCSLGRITTKWQQAVSKYYRRDNKTLDAAYWASLFITALWKYTKALWQHRNETIHGAITEESAQLIIVKLWEKISLHFTAFNDNEDYVLPRHSYLFNQKPLTQLLQSSCDYLQCWLLSVEEAKSIQALQEAHLRAMSRRFFSMFPGTQPTTDDAAEYDSSYYPSTIDDVSIPTVSTTLTLTCTKSSIVMDDSSTLTHSTSSTMAYMALFSIDDNSHTNSSSISPSANSLNSNITKNNPTYNISFNSTATMKSTHTDDISKNTSPFLPIPHTLICALGT